MMNWSVAGSIAPRPDCPCPAALQARDPPRNCATIADDGFPDRTGHDGHSMIERYRRKARTWNLGELGCFYELIPELAEPEPTVRIRPGLPLKFTARVAKLADAPDLGSAAARRMGSTPFPCTFNDLGNTARVLLDRK